MGRAGASEILDAFVDMVAERVVEKMGKPDVSRAMSTEEAAKFTGMSEYAIRQAVHDEELPCVRVGRVMKFLKGDLDAWLQRNRTE